MKTMSPPTGVGSAGDESHGKRQHKLALFLVAVVLLAFGVFVYFVFVFPKIIAAWGAEAEPLSVAARMVARLSLFCRSHGLVLLPLLMAGIGAGAVWAVMSAPRISRAREHKERQGRESPLL